MRSKPFVIRTRYFSYMLERRAVYWWLILFAMLLLMFCVSAGIGTLWISPVEVVQTVFGYGSDTAQTTLFSFRLPRAVMAVLAGACLAVSGSLLQSVARNPLASPDMIGITGGASASGVGFLVLTGGAYGIGLLPVFAMLGAVLVSFLLFALAWKNGLSPLRLVLIGVALQTAATSLTSFLIIMSPYYIANQAFTWITGSVYGNSWNNIKELLPWAFVLIMMAGMLARRANVHELGDDVAAGVGSRVSSERMLLVLISAALAGAAVSQVGAIGFVGLMAPHMARRLVGPSFGTLWPAAACIGAMLLLAADTIGRTAFAPLDIPAGVFTAAVGAPFFIYLLLRRRNGK